MTPLDADTIVAVSTPPGKGGIGIVRLSGELSPSIAATLFRPRGGSLADGFEPLRLTLGHIVDFGGELIDEAFCVYMPPGRSYTFEATIEFHAHGGPVVLGRIIEAAVACGARPAEPGEFTRRAFLNGRLDLSQAEAVMALIDARSGDEARHALRQLDGEHSRDLAQVASMLSEAAASLEASLDFSEEEDLDPPPVFEIVKRAREALSDLLKLHERGRLRCEVAPATLVGAKNTGKSSIYNALLGDGAAIVTPEPGTTRDVLSAELSLGAFAVRLSDTAGMGEARDPVEAEGIRRSREQVKRASALVVVLDGSRPLLDEDRLILRQTTRRPSFLVVNKCDLQRGISFQELDSLAVGRRTIVTSALTGEGMPSLRNALREMLEALYEEAEEPAVYYPTARHVDAMKRSCAALDQALRAHDTGFHPDAIAADLREAREALGCITGEVFSDSLLDDIFGRFCIGK